jgi:transposase
VAVNNRDENFTKAKLKKRIDQVEASIERYMAAVETADRQEGDGPKNSLGAVVCAQGPG